MLTVGLAKTGVRLVNRSSTGVAEWEIRQAMQKYIGDGKTYAEPGSSVQLPYRPMLAGSILGSTHYVSGAISELNWNIHSTAKELGVGGLSVGRREYRISIAIDLIVTDTRSTEIVFARTYTKQLVGTEVATNLFRFFDVGGAHSSLGKNEVFEFNLGKEMNEPVQAAVRWILETGAYDIVTELSGIGAECDKLVPGREVAVVPGAAVRPTVNTAKPAMEAAPVKKVAESNALINVITGISLLNDNGLVVARIDTLFPMKSAPTVVSGSLKTPVHDKLVIDLVGMSADHVDVSKLALGVVSGVQVMQMPDRTRLTFNITTPTRANVEKAGKSMLVSFGPAVVKPVSTIKVEPTKVSPVAAPKELAPVVAGDQVLNAGEAPSLLEQKKGPEYKTPEQLEAIIHH
jgi:curli biogenesis system outer membrane secretion channel CsgG